MADKWDGKGRREADRGKRNLISDSASTSALVAGDHVSITRSESDHSVMSRLNRFILVTIVTGVLLCAALGYQAIRG